MLKNITPTAGEKVLVQRRRDEYSRHAAVAMYPWAQGVSTFRFGQWERGEVEAPNIDIGQLQDYEVCLLLRRRAKVSQMSVAQGLSYCRYWVNLMEQGKKPCDSLVEYWEKRPNVEER